MGSNDCVRRWPMFIVLTGCGTLILAAFGLVFYGMIKNQAINVAAEKGDIDAIRSILDEHPDLIEQRSRVGWTPLQEAACAGQVDAIKLLIQRGADMGAKWKPSTDDGDWTALHIAVNWSRVEAAKALIEAGIDVNSRTRLGETALDIAQHPNRRNDLDKFRLIALLEANGGKSGK